MEDADRWARVLPGLHGPALDVCIVDLGAPTLYKDVPHWALRKIGTEGARQPEYIVLVQDGTQYLAVTTSREAALTLAASQGRTDWVEPARITPSACPFRRFWLAHGEPRGHFYEL